MRRGRIGAAAAWLAGGALIFALLSAGVERLPLYSDEAATMVNAWSLSQSGRDEYGVRHPLYFRSFGDDKAPLFIYANAAVLKAWPFADIPRELGRLVGAALCALGFCLAGAAAVGLAGMPSAWGLLPAMLFALNPASFHLSRYAIEVAALTPLFLGAYLLCAASDRWGGVGLWLGAAPYAAHLFKVLSPLIALFEGLQLWRGRRLSELRRLALVYLLCSIPLGFQLASGEGLGRAAQVGTSASPVGLAARYPVHFSPGFLLLRGDSNPRHSPGGAGLVAVALFALAAWGLAAPARLAPGPWAARLAFLLLASPLPSAITRESVPHATRAYVLGLCLVFTSGLAALRLVRERRCGALALIATVLLIQDAIFLRRYLQVYPRESAVAWMDGFQPWRKPGGEVALNNLLRHPELLGSINGPTELLRWEALRLGRARLRP